MMLKLVEAKNPKFSSADRTTIDMECTWNIGGPWPFTASVSDTEAHGRDIYARALAGEFGPVAPYVPPSV